MKIRVLELDSDYHSNDVVTIYVTRMMMTQPQRFVRHGIYSVCRSQWPRVFRHELSSSARTMGSNPTLCAFILIWCRSVCR
jgi:hypothetical protein